MSNQMSTVSMAGSMLNFAWMMDVVFVSKRTLWKHNTNFVFILHSPHCFKQYKSKITRDKDFVLQSVQTAGLHHMVINCVKLKMSFNSIRLTTVSTHGIWPFIELSRTKFATPSITSPLLSEWETVNIFPKIFTSYPMNISFPKNQSSSTCSWYLISSIYQMWGNY